MNTSIGIPDQTGQHLEELLRQCLSYNSQEKKSLEAMATALSLSHDILKDDGKPVIKNSNSEGSSESLVTSLLDPPLVAHNPRIWVPARSLVVEGPEANGVNRYTWSRRLLPSFEVRVGQEYYTILVDDTIDYNLISKTLAQKISSGEVWNNYKRNKCINTNKYVFWHPISMTFFGNPCLLTFSFVDSQTESCVEDKLIFFEIPKWNAKDDRTIILGSPFLSERLHAARIKSVKSELQYLNLENKTCTVDFTWKLVEDRVPWNSEGKPMYDVMRKVRNANNREDVK